MDSRPRHRGLLVPVALALLLAFESSLVVLAVGVSPASAPVEGPAVTVARDGPAAGGGERALDVEDRLATLLAAAPQPPAIEQPVAPVPPVAETPVPTPTAVPNVVAEATPKPPAKAAVKAPVKATAVSYRGKNRMWIPALGVNRSVSFYSCSRRTALANVVYRWGCAGRNNVYLMGHAHSVFKALHDAYVRKRLKKGMQVIYADSSGRVTKYRVSFWKVVSPVGAGWAFASQSRPSLTLQTCVGARSQYRLVVRLVASA